MILISESIVQLAQATGAGASMLAEALHNARVRADEDQRVLQRLVEETKNEMVNRLEAQEKRAEERDKKFDKILELLGALQR